MIPAFAALLLAQISPADLRELRVYRYGLTAAQIEAMGEESYTKLYNQKTKDHDVGFMRGVAIAVYVDAYRENTGRLYRGLLTPAVRLRLLALDMQIRFVGVLFARNDWALRGGNAFNPESDELDFAQAERQLYTLKRQTPNATRMRRRLATYKKEIREKGRKETFFGFLDKPAEGRREIERNLAKIDAAVKKAEGLCRTAAEKAVLYDFVAGQAVARF